MTNPMPISCARTPETRRNLGSWRLVTVIEQPFCENWDNFGTASDTTTTTAHVTGVKANLEAEGFVCLAVNFIRPVNLITDGFQSTGGTDSLA